MKKVKSKGGWFDRAVSQLNLSEWSLKPSFPKIASKRNSKDYLDNNKEADNVLNRSFSSLIRRQPFKKSVTPVPNSRQSFSNVNRNPRSTSLCHLDVYTPEEHSTEMCYQKPIASSRILAEPYVKLEDNKYKYDRTATLVKKVPRPDVSVHRKPFS